MEYKLLEVLGLKLRPFMYLIAIGWVEVEKN